MIDISKIKTEGNMAKLYVITGPSGVGKSVTTSKLAEKLGKCAILEGDEIYHQVYGAEKPWLEGNHLDVMWKNILDLSRNYLDADIDVVFNYIISDKSLEKIKTTLAKYEIHFVVLMANLDTILKRDEERDEDCQTHRAEVHLNKIKEYGFDEKFMLNTENKSIEEIADEILCGGFMLQSAVPKSHCSGLQKLYFDKVVSGEKTIEGRLNDEKRQGINEGDAYVFGLEPGRREMVRKIVKKKTVFKNFNEFCERVDPKKAGFSNKQEMQIVYNTIYSKELQEKYGVVAIEVE